jgi:hypothetical protein
MAHAAATPNTAVNRLAAGSNPARVRVHFFSFSIKEVGKRGFEGWKKFANVFSVRLDLRRAQRRFLRMPIFFLTIGPW